MSAPELEKKQTALRDNNELLRTLFENSPDAVVLIDADTSIILDCNIAACRMNGYSRDELIGQSIHLLNVAEYEEIHLNALLNGMGYIPYLRQHRHLKYETCHRHKDGTVFPIEVSTNLITIDGHDILLGIDRDISDRKEAESALRSSQERYRLLTQYALDVISYHAPDGSLLYASPALKNVLGYTFEEVKGVHPTDLIHPDDVEAMARAAQGGDRELYMTTCRLRHKDGYYVWLEINGRYKRNPFTNRIEEVICVSRDISDRKRAEAAAQEKSALIEALEEAASAIKSSLHMNDVLDRILAQAARVVPHDTSSITLIEDEHACIVRCRGFADDQVDYVLAQRFPIAGSAKHRYMVEERMPILIDDVQLYEGWTQTPDTSWIRAHVAAPIVVRDQVIGFLHLDSAQCSAFTAEHARHLQTFADQVGLAIYTAQMVDDVSATYRAASMLFASFVADNVTDLSYQIANTILEEYPGVECSVMLLENEAGRINRLAHAGSAMAVLFPSLTMDGTSLIATSINSGEILYVPDVSLDGRYIQGFERTRSELVIPLRSRYAVIGALDIQSPALDGFSLQDQRVLSTFADRAAVAVENLRYAEQLERLVATHAAEAYRATEHVDAILKSTGDALIVVTHTDHAIRQINPAFSQLFGYSADESVGKRLSDFALNEKDVLAKALGRVLEYNEPQRIEILLLRRDATAFDADVTISPIREGNTTLGLVCSVRDITERKRMEIELRRALEQERELGELKTRFVSNTSHEFRTPLAIIMTASELLLTYGERMTDEQKITKLQHIQEQVAHMAHLLDDVLTVNKTVGGSILDFDPVPLDMVAFCKSLLDEIEKSLDQKCFILVAEGQYNWGNYDPHLLRDILSNLFSNAVKYSTADELIEVHLWCDKTQISLQISDKGIGIHPEDQKRLFDAFHRGANVGNTPGTGLGLTIVKHAIEAHGGTIEVRSKIGVGTTFTVMLPNVPVEGTS